MAKRHTVGHDAKQARSEVTRRKVIDAAIACFADEGFDRASTREIVRRAGTNLVAIHYHFGGKQELYRAAAQQIAQLAHASVRDWIDPARTLLRDRHAPREAFIECLWTVYDRFLDEALAGRAVGGMPDHWRRFLLRELQGSDEAFAIVYPVMEPLYETIFALIGRVIDRPADDARVRLIALMCFGQVNLIRCNRTLALRFLGIRRVGEAERSEIRVNARAEMIQLLAPHMTESNQTARQAKRRRLSEKLPQSGPALATGSQL